MCRCVVLYCVALFVVTYTFVYVVYVNVQCVHIHIREPVDSLCRDETDAPIAC